MIYQLKQNIYYLLNVELTMNSIVMYYPEYSNYSKISNLDNIVIYDSEPYIQGVNITESIVLLESCTELWMIIIIKKFFRFKRELDKIISLLDTIVSCKEIQIVKIFELMLILFSYLTREELIELEILSFDSKYKAIFIDNRAKLYSLLDEFKEKDATYYYESGIKVQLSTEKKRNNNNNSKLVHFENKENIMYLSNLSNKNKSKFNCESTNCSLNKDINKSNNSSVNSTIMTITAPILVSHVLLIDKNVFNHGLFCIIKCISKQALLKAAGSEYAIIPLKNVFSIKDRPQAKSDIDEIRKKYSQIAYIPHTMKDDFLNFIK